MWRLVTVASLGLAITIAAVAWLAYGRPEIYYALLQEDGPLEWAAFFAFALAAPLWAWRALHHDDALVRCAPVLVALFCAFVAAEEISWAQRLSGARAPAFFLAHNFQQELNLHNLAASGTRKLAMGLVLGGYGVLLPLAVGRAPWPRALAGPAAAGAPPLAFAPAFAVALALYVVYPLPFTGEIVEWLLGMLLLFAAMAPSRATPAVARRVGPGTRACLALLTVVALALGATRASVTRAGDPDAVARAEREIAALAEDLAAAPRTHAGTLTECGTHQRLFAFARDAGAGALRRGRFAELARAGGDDERMAYFLDPWNQAYWIRHECDDTGRERAFVYSFGPNRRRDSGVFDLDRADVGAYLFHE
jgi:hypothetical protein